MANTESVTLTLTADVLSAPIVIDAAGFGFTLPVAGDAKFVAVSEAGSSDVVDVDFSLSVQGLPLITNDKLASFPIDLKTVLGVLYTWFTNEHVTLTLDVKAV